MHGPRPPLPRPPPAAAHAFPPPRASQLASDGLQLLINLERNAINLVCGQVIRVLWSVTWPSPWVPWFPVEAIPEYPSAPPPAIL